MRLDEESDCDARRLITVDRCFNSPDGGNKGASTQGDACPDP